MAMLIIHTPLNEKCGYSLSDDGKEELTYAKAIDQTTGAPVF